MPSTHEMFLFQRNRQDPHETFSGNYDWKLINKAVIRHFTWEIPVDSQQWGLLRGHDSRFLSNPNTKLIPINKSGVWKYSLQFFIQQCTCINLTMLELFVIFSKGGIVLWMFQGASQVLTTPVNALVKDVILQVCMYCMICWLMVYACCCRVVDGWCLLLHMLCHDFHFF